MRSTPIVCLALLGALLFGLGLAVSLARTKVARFDGYAPGSDDFLHKLVRAHGNTAEYAPYLGVLIVYLASRPIATWVEWVIVGTTAARFAIVVGLLAFQDMAKPNPVRFIGALGTYIGGLALCWAAVA
jgi:hypothetical protein